MQTIVDQIIDRAGVTGTLTVLDSAADVVEQVSWRDLHDRARRMAAVLIGRGLWPGARVGLLGDTSTDLVAALQAVWLAGAAVTVLPTAGHRDQLRAVVADAGLSLLLADDSKQDVGPALSLTALARAADAVAPASPRRPAPADLALLQYTSGSTRAPRGVPVTHGHLAANLAATKAGLDHNASHPSRMLSWLPLYHDLGLIAFLTMPMSCGCPLLLQSPVAFARRPASWLQAMSRYRVTMSGAPNFAYSLMTRLLAGDMDIDLSAVRCLVSGGEPIDAQMMTRFTAAAGRYGLDPAVITPGYGLAETTLTATVSPVGAGVLVDSVDRSLLEAEGRAVPAQGAQARPLVRLGRPVQGTTLRVVDRLTGEPVGERTVGHIELQGPSVVGRYWREPQPPPGRWLRTGDLGYLAGGELVVCGREKDVLFAAGRNVYPQDIEAIAVDLPGVRPGGVAAFGVPQAEAETDHLVVAVETRSADPAAVRRAVATAVRDEVGMAPGDVVLLPPGRLPRTSSGKLRRAETRRRYLAGELGPLARKLDVRSGG